MMVNVPKNKKSELPINEHNSDDIGSRRERLVTLDQIRAVAIFLVITNHCFELVYNPNLSTVSCFSLKQQLFCFAGFTAGRAGVPLFLMLTGYLLLQRDYSGNNIKLFYGKHLIPLLLTWEIWILIYNVFLMLYNNTDFNVFMYIRNALFIEHTELIHTWYMPVIIGVYLFLPFVAQVVVKMKGKVLLMLMVVVYMYNFVVPSFNLIQLANHVGTNNQFINQLNLNFGGGIYGLYLAMGYVFNRYKREIEKYFSSISTRVFIFGLGLLSFWLTVLYQLFLYHRGYSYNVWYSFFLMPVIGGCLFSLISIRKRTILYRLTEKISRYSFGMYLTHIMIIYILREKALKISDRSTETFVLIPVVFFLSFATVHLLSRISIVGRWLFLVRKE